MAENKKSKLNLRQQRFVNEYLKDLNATQAAKRAGYSEKTVNQIGPRLLVNVRVADAIAKAVHKRAERTRITIDEVVTKIVDIAMSDDRPQDQTRCLDMLMKHLGGYQANNRLDVDFRITQIAQRIQAMSEDEKYARLKRLKQPDR
jgi:phage terminase small subunit